MGYELTFSQFLTILAILAITGIVLFVSAALGRREERKRHKEVIHRVSRRRQQAVLAARQEDNRPDRGNRKTNSRHLLCFHLGLPLLRS